MFLKLEEATISYDEEEPKPIFNKKAPIWVSVKAILYFVDHVVVLPGQKVFVMETAEQIYVKLVQLNDRMRRQ